MKRVAIAGCLFLPICTTYEIDSRMLLTVDVRTVLFPRVLAPSLYGSYHAPQESSNLTLFWILFSTFNFVESSNTAETLFVMGTQNPVPSLFSAIDHSCTIYASSATEGRVIKLMPKTKGSAAGRARQ